MNNLNKDKRNVITGAYVLTMTVLAFAAYSVTAISSSTTTNSLIQAAYAQEANNTTAASTPSDTTATTTTTNTSSGIQLSPQLILQEQTTTTSQTPINQTHISAIFSGNGTLTLPGTTETINFTTNGTALISLLTHSTQAIATIMTEQGETATATFYEILKIDPAMSGAGKGLTTAVINTDSIGTLEPLNGTILAGISDLKSNKENTVTLWEWESGISNNANDDGGAPSIQ
jgi:hypothetical protein